MSKSLPGNARFSYPVICVGRRWAQDQVSIFLRPRGLRSTFHSRLPVLRCAALARGEDSRARDDEREGATENDVNSSVSTEATHVLERIIRINLDVLMVIYEVNSVEGKAAAAAAPAQRPTVAVAAPKILPVESPARKTTTRRFSRFHSRAMRVLTFAVNGFPGFK